MSPTFQSTHSESEYPCLEVGTNWWDVCIFELNEPGFIQSLILSRSDPVEAQSLIWLMSGWGYSTVRLSTRTVIITTIWQWQWCLNADSGSTNLMPNAAYKAEKYENSGGTERILLYLWQPFSRFVVCSLVQVSMDHAWINGIKCKDLGVGCDVGATGETYSFKTRSREL